MLPSIAEYPEVPQDIKSPLGTKISPAKVALVPIVAKDVVKVLWLVVEPLPFGLKNTVPSELVESVTFVSLEVK